MRRRLLVILSGLLLTTACASTPAAATAPLPPLATSLTTPDGTWVLLPLGQSGQPLETFWQAFHLAGPSSRWVLRTPPGVADNGGLVIADAGSSTLLGVLPSNLLTFSPLALTVDGGRTYTPNLVPGALAAVPDAIAVGADGRSYALTPNQILTSSAGAAGWSVQVSAAAVTGAPAAQPCGVQGLTALADTASGLLIGASCDRAGTVGVLAADGSTIAATGPRLPPTEAPDRVTVMRLVPDGDGAAALLKLDGRTGRSYVAAWQPTRSGGWQLSPPLRAPGRLLSSSVTSGAGFAVVVADTGGAMAATVGPGSAGWHQLPALPAGTSSLAVTNGRVDALVGGVTTFTDYRLTGQRWTRAQVLSVAVPFGSSS
jgi:hypothetical protein